jgi:D-glycero-D-manno-heptose 1,7-bisphosphate phosphatase
MAKALFLDRDGVINVDNAYVSHIEDFEFIDGIFELCRAAVKKGYLLVVVTNQAGIGRGLYTESDFNTLTDWMKSRFVQENCALTAVYYCPTHPEYGIGKYRRESIFRKPNPGMLLQAAKEHDIDMKASLIIGDKLSDMQAGKSSGIGASLLFSNTQKSHDEGVVQINTLNEALQHL